jgi:hypothetical protein
MPCSAESDNCHSRKEGPYHTLTGRIQDCQKKRKKERKRRRKKKHLTASIYAR